MNGKRLTWQHGVVPSDGLSWVYQVKPTEAGTYYTNDLAEAEYLDVDGERKIFTSPAADHGRDPKPKGLLRRETWTVMVHSFPDTVGVSSTSVPRGCNLNFDSGDWATGTAYRLPDLEYELTDASGVNVLYRGKGVPGPGRVDQRLYISTCEPPPYKIRLLTTELNGYATCPNGPPELDITIRNFRPKVYRAPRSASASRVLADPKTRNDPEGGPRDDRAGRPRALPRRGPGAGRCSGVGAGDPRVLLRSRFRPRPRTRSASILRRRGSSTGS